MNEHSLNELSNDEALRLHQRLLERDPTATADFIVAFFAPLAAWLELHNPRVDPHLCHEAASDAVFHFSEQPHAYDPARATVTAYLRMAASGDLKNLLRKEQRHQRQRKPWNCVEDEAAAGKYLGKDDDPSLPLQIAETQRVSPAERAVFEKLSDQERQVWELMRQGERRTSVYAEVLGLAELPTEAKAKQVQRVKDRVGRRMKRAEQSDE